MPCATAKAARLDPARWRFQRGAGRQGALFFAAEFVAALQSSRGRKRCSLGPAAARAGARLGANLRLVGRGRCIRWRAQGWRCGVAAAALTLLQPGLQLVTGTGDVWASSSKTRRLKVLGAINSTAGALGWRVWPGPVLCPSRSPRWPLAIRNWFNGMAVGTWRVNASAAVGADEAVRVMLGRQE